MDVYIRRDTAEADLNEAQRLPANTIVSITIAACIEETIVNITEQGVEYYRGWGTEYLDSLLRIIRISRHSLVQITFYENWIGKKTVEALGPALVECTKLQTLNFRSTHFINASLKHWAAYFPQLKQLQELVLPSYRQIDIAVLSIEEVCRVIPKCHALQVVEVGPKQDIYPYSRYLADLSPKEAHELWCRYLPEQRTNNELCYFRVQRALDETFRRRALFTLWACTCNVASKTSPASQFVCADGDYAVAHCVFSWLV